MEVNEIGYGILSNNNCGGSRGIPSTVFGNEVTVGAKHASRTGTCRWKINKAAQITDIFPFWV